jgi:phosphoserine phosphatase RsbU/P
MRVRYRLNTVGFILLAFIGWTIFILLAPRVFSMLRFDLTLNREQVTALAKQTAQALGYRVDRYKARVTLANNERLLRFIQDHYQDEERHAALSSVPAFYWQVVWYAPKSRIAQRHSSDPDSPPAKTSMAGLALDFDLHGRPLAFRLTEEEGGPITNLSAAAAAAMADSVLHLIRQGKPVTAPVTRVSHTATDRSTSYGFLYLLPEEPFGLHVRFRVEISGRLVKKWEYLYEPEGAPAAPSISTYSVRMVSLLALLILYVVFFIRRLRSDLVDFRHLALVPVLMGLTTLVLMLGEVWGGEYDELIGPLAAALLFFPLVIWLAYACGDSMVREVWEDKLLSLDALYKGYWLNRRFGASVLAGTGLGACSLGATALILYLAGRVTQVDMIPWSTEFNSMITWSPFFFGLSRIVHSTLWLQFGVMLFIMALLARAFSKPGWIIAGAALAWGVGLQGMINLPSAPFWVSLLVAGSIGALQALAFVRWDFLASIVCQALWMSALVVMHMLFLNQPSFYGSVAGLLLLWLGLLAAALAAWQRPVEEEALKRFLPAHAARIVERMRLRRELEIARDVQLNFLPKSDPELPGLDIASRCLPAQEVAGDYYDFITLDDHRLGLAIGDVAGKGISAAFYMTLTKGFLRSLTQNAASPRQVMMQMNRLYWDNVDRSHFISMIYGVFDTQLKTLTFVRAGHNPVILIRRQQETILAPKGLALGLEKGILFDQTLEEQVVALQSEDLFVFYTDGFSEARNRQLEEFGDQRLMHTLHEHSQQSAGVILQAAQNRVAQFVDRGLQHDDMTMVVVRVTHV